MSKFTEMSRFGLFLFLVISAASGLFAQETDERHAPVLAVHGGAGNITVQNFSHEEREKITHAMTKALQEGYAVLASGGSSLNAVLTTIRILEDSPHFNAGKGAVYNSNGEHELDASIMDGKTLNAGAVAGVRHIKNPITAALLVMEKSRHVLLVGEGAEEFAREQGVEMVENSYFNTKKKKRQLENSQKREGQNIQSGREYKYGTVGAVALDRRGNLAAGTSTGGLTNKSYGRVGDSPIIGAGTYANNKTCGISGTGVGEYFMRGLVAYDVSALMEYKGYSLEEAAREVILKKLTAIGGEGGVIGVDKDGNVSLIFNTPGMIRGYVDKSGKVTVRFFGE